MLRKLILSLAGCLILGLGFAAAQQQQPAGPPPSPRPGPEHLKLKELEGNWDAVVTGMDGQKSKGEASYKMECGGLWLTSDFKSQMDDQPFHGKGFDSYDPAKKKYLGVWVDSMMTVPMMTEGTRDERTKTTTCTGECPGPDGKPMKVKMVTKEVNSNQHTFEMYMIGPDGKETKSMTIEYTRRKS